ncbi:uncharacterized protein IWZ02DRAFT_513697 [Phyllosticta citriasiana]|uniref:uncharacterized protein n=1 Tax=Phyllosticta citriasiana TaxID=595635 RepID=UPI0030FD4A0B
MTAPAEHQSQQRVLVPRRKIFDGLERSDSEEYILISRVGHDPKRLPERPQNRLTNYEARAFLRRDLGIPDSMRFPLGYGLLGLKKVVMSPVSSLTHQVVRGREITVTENPGQRLVWNNRRILIKPLPLLLLSTVFWEASVVGDAHGEDIHQALSVSDPVPITVRTGGLERTRSY